MPQFDSDQKHQMPNKKKLITQSDKINYVFVHTSICSDVSTGLNPTNGICIDIIVPIQ